MKLYVNHKILGGFFVSMIIISSLGVGSFLFISEMIRVSRQGVNAQHVLFLSERVRSLHAETQTATMNFVLTGKEEFSKAYLHSLQDMRNHVRELDSLTVHQQEQQEYINQLKLLSTSMAQWLDQVHVMRRQSEAEATRLLLAPESATAAAGVSSLIDKIQYEVSILRRQQQAAVTKQFYQFAFTFFGLVLTGLAIPLVLAYALNRNLKVRTMAEEKLRQASATIHDLYENAPCGYFSIDKQGMFINVNKTLLAWLGYSRDQVVDRFHFTDIITPKAADVYDKDFDQLKQRGFIADIESRLVRKDKSVVPVVINATAIMDSNNAFVSSRCSLFDITERKKAEAESRRLNAELEAFSYSVSHDLRAPLRSVNGFAKILKEDYGSKMDEEGNRVIGKIVNNASRMGQLIDDLLDFSRIGKKEINKSEINTKEFIAQIAKELVDQENGRAIELDIQSVENCNADVSMIRQVWVNLVSNALKYSRNQQVTRIEIGSQVHPEEVVFYIKDNGVGFDMKFINKLFGVFQRLHRMEDFEGTGVGLALVKRIIERHNGRIWADAKLNEGASFYFAIPKA